MDKLTILLNQIETDLQQLYLDVNEGLYEKNVEGFLTELERIGKKLNQAKDLRNEEADINKIRSDEAKADELEQLKADEQRESPLTREEEKQ